MPVLFESTFCISGSEDPSARHTRGINRTIWSIGLLPSLKTSENFLKQITQDRDLIVHVGQTMENFAASDLAWVSRVMGGDTVAGDELVERLRPTVARIVRGRVTLRAEEEDLTQAVFLKVFGNLQSFSGRVPLEHWVSRIAVNVCLQQFRHERRRRELRRADLSAEEDLLLDVVAASDNEVGPDQQLTAQDLVARIFEVLSPRERIVMSLLHLEGQDLEEAARLTGNSNLAVRLIAFRARRKMKKAFQKLQQGEWK